MGTQCSERGEKCAIARISPSLRAEYTQHTVANAVDRDQAWVSRAVENMQNGKLSELHQAYEPPLYDIWRLKEKEVQTDFFGA